MTKIGICGGPSSGKTTLAKALTNKLGLLGHNPEYIGEYARYHINMCKQNGIYAAREPIDQQIIFYNQLRWENAVNDEVDFLVSDSPIFMTAVYGHMLTDFRNYKHRTFYHQLYEQILEMKDRYDHVFFLPSEIEFKADGLRVEDAERAQKIGEQIRAFLVFHDYRWHEITGSLDERVEKCYKILIGSELTEGVTNGKK